eukprot:TRINITY_DN26519_c0_g2_i2.p1 TRINITY_DN26519_c0_g2~~TRINITY_DN26519_c0_g2_i2.p1  ORF type:complete len:475 (-),score=57.00 TRINITY_DN26519_c0_g2_i2:187-1512(-)
MSSACNGEANTVSRTGSQQQRTPLWTLKANQLLGTAAWACMGKFITAFYSDIGVSRNQIGLLQFIGPLASFFGQFFWAAVIDRVGDYKWILVSTTFVGSAIALCQMLSVVQESFTLLAVVSLSSNLFLCTGGPIIDAMCLTVLDEQNEDEGYGDQRLWCAIGWGGMSLIAGQMVDMYGINFIFYGFVVFQSINMAICLIWLPGKKRKPAAVSGEAESFSMRQLCNFDVFWLFANILQYGVAMCLVENFLLVFLLQDFMDTPKMLVGASVAVMCVFEVPVFKYIDRLWNGGGMSLTQVILGCQLILALRCWLYMLLPAQRPWLVLLIEPLHGVTFAAMWAATVEYAKRLAPPQATARMQTLVNGLYYQVAMGLGSVLWGQLVEKPPAGFGFKHCFLIDSVVVLGWCVIWQTGLFFRARQCRARELRGASVDLLAEMQSGERA